MTLCRRCLRRLILFPNWFYFNIYEISARGPAAIVVPLSIMRMRRSHLRRFAAEQGIDELFVGRSRERGSASAVGQEAARLAGGTVMLAFDRMAHWLPSGVHIQPSTRKVAIKRAEKWLLERFEMSDGLGAIYPAMMNRDHCAEVLWGTRTTIRSLFGRWTSSRS